jgi:hypothetical protein
VPLPGAKELRYVTGPIGSWTPCQHELMMAANPLFMADTSFPPRKLPEQGRCKTAEIDINEPPPGHCAGRSARRWDRAVTAPSTVARPPTRGAVEKLEAIVELIQISYPDYSNHPQKVPTTPT